MEQQIIDNLKSLKALLDSGVLTAEEFEAEKSKLLYKDAKQEPQEQGLPVQPEKQPTVLPKTQQETTPKDSEKPACKSCKFNFLLWWAVIYVVAGVITTFLGDMIFSGGYWNASLGYRRVYYLLLIVCHIGNILPAFAIKNKTYRIPCLIGVGLLSLYYIYQTVQNMMIYAEG